MNIANTFSLLAVVAACTGCASQMLSDDRLRANTAPLIGVSASEITILNRNELGTNTFYTARTNAGVEYQCSINGGGVLAAGIVQGGQCTKKGEAAKPAASSAQEPWKAAAPTPVPVKAKTPVKK